MRELHQNELAMVSGGSTAIDGIECAVDLTAASITDFEDLDFDVASAIDCTDFAEDLFDDISDDF